MKLYKVIKGDSTVNIKATVTNYPSLDQNWGCKTRLVKDLESTSLPIIEKAAVKRIDLSAFDVYFKPSETIIKELISGSIYYWLVEMSNPTLNPPYKETIINRLEIDLRG